MTMIVTDAGIASSRNAEQGGFLINLPEFSVSEASGFEITPERTALVGQETFRGQIDSIEAIDMSTMRFTCRIPAGRPASGQWVIGEVGIWDANGQLFAHGDVKQFPKSGEYGLRFYVYVTMARLGTVINITTSETFSLPSAARVSSLLPPTESTQNTVVVGDANAHQEEIDSGWPANTSSPALAIKHGPGGTYWAFTGHSRIYIGKPDSVPNLGAINLDPSTNGFWLTDGEVVIAQVLSGAGVGQSRKMRYSHAAKRLISIDKDFTALNADSKIAVWRSHENSLPARHAGIPDYMVLGAGLNTYRATVASTSATRLVPYGYQFTGTGADEYLIPASELPISTLDGKDYLLLIVNGVCYDPSRFSISGSSIRIPGGVPNGQTARLWGFTRSESGGGEMIFQEAVYPVVAGKADYSLPIVPDSKDYMLLLLNGVPIPESSYTLDGARARFVAGQIPSTGDLTILCCGNILSEDARGSVVRDRITLDGNANSFLDLSEPVASLRNLMIFSNGTYLPRSAYSVNGLRVRLRQPLSNTVVDVMNFRATATTQVVGKSGVDTGPAWVDPAGAEGMPNKLVPKRRRYVATGQPNFEVDPVLNSSHLVVLVGERFLPPTDFHYDGQFVWPNEILNGSVDVDIIAFTSIDHPGTSARPQVTRVTGNGGRTYQIHVGGNAESMIVTVNGNSVPSVEWSYDASSGVLTLNSSVLSGSEIEVWNYADVDEAGKQVRMFCNITPISTARRYVVEGELDNENDMVAFASGTGIGHHQFSLANSGGFSFFEFDAVPGANLIGLDLQVVNFQTKEPRSRLILREELPNITEGFLQSNKNLSDVENAATARANLGIDPIINAIYQQLNTKLNNWQNLADVPDKAAARDNLGITNIIADLLGRVLLKENNLADVPDKAAARANLGIDQNMGITGDWSNPSSWWFRVGPMLIQGGRYAVVSPLNEGAGPVISYAQGYGQVLSVVAVDMLRTPSATSDLITQIAQPPNNSNFTIYRQRPGSGTANWFGCMWIAIGV